MAFRQMVRKCQIPHIAFCYIWSLPSDPQLRPRAENPTVFQHHLIAIFTCTFNYLSTYVWLAIQFIGTKEILGHPHRSADTIPRSLDKAMDAANKPAKHAAPGISIRNGPVEAMDIDQQPGPNSKRKGRASMSNGVSYKDASDDSEEDKPLVCHFSYLWACWD